MMPGLRRLTTADLPAAQRLSAAFGWPHRLEDWALVHALGSGHAVELDGQLAGTVLGWRFGAEAAAIGMIIVAPTAQGRGLGRRLTEAMLAELGPCRIALLATEAGRPLYAKLGFQPTGLVRQHQGKALAGGRQAPRPGEALRPLSGGDVAALAALDRMATGLDRSKALAALLEVAEGVVLERDGTPAGFALLRRFGHGHLIGPVIAPDTASAQALIGHWLDARGGEFLRIDVPDAAGLGPWLAKRGLADVGTALPMLRGVPAPPPRGPQSFALINQALG